MAKLSCGIVGLPNVGKSSLFNALTKANAASSNYPFCTIEPNVGIVAVYDPRLAVLAELSHSKKIIYASMEFVDIAGLVKGASQGEGLGNQFLSHIRETSAILHMVRCFEGSDVTHVSGHIDPLRDIEIINLELVMADLQSVQNILARVEKQAKSKKELVPTIDLLQKVREHLDKGQPLRRLSLSDKEQLLLQPYPFLTTKQVLYIANIGEEDLPAMDNAYVRQVRAYAATEGSEVIPISAKIEAEVSELSDEEQRKFLSDLGLEEPGLRRLTRHAFKMLGLITFLTAGEMEARAWPIRKGTSAYEAAAEIHTDIQKGFVRAEIIAYEDFKKYKGRLGAKEAGRLRIEGKEYIIEDGDVVLFLC